MSSGNTPPGCSICSDDPGVSPNVVTKTIILEYKPGNVAFGGCFRKHFGCLNKLLKHPKCWMFSMEEEQVIEGI